MAVHVWLQKPLWRLLLLRQWLCLHGLVSRLCAYPCFHHIWDVVFTCMMRNLDIHTPAYRVNIGILFSHYCILFVQVPVMFFYYRSASRLNYTPVQMTKHWNTKLCVCLAPEARCSYCCSRVCVTRLRPCMHRQSAAVSYPRYGVNTLF